MKIGSIRSAQKCSKCGALFCKENNFRCPVHDTRADRFFIYVRWDNQTIRIFSNEHGIILDSLAQTQFLLAKINEQVQEKSFDPSKFVKQDLKKFFAKNLLAEFLKHKLRNIAPSYRGNYRRMVEEATGFFRSRDVRLIRKLDIVNYADHLRKIQIGGKTLKNYLDLLKVFLNWCHKDLEIIDKIPNFPEAQYQLPQVRWLSQEDQIKLYLLVPDEDKPIIAFMMLHGCRPGEARALRCGDIDLRNQTATIKSTFSGKEIREKRKGKNSKSVIIPIHPECLPFIQQRVKTSLPGAFLFITSKRKAYSVQKLRKVWDKVRAASGVEGLKLYEATRHSVASQLVSAGVSLYQVQQILGHSDSRMTERYAHPDLESIRADLRKLSLKEKVIDLCTGLALEKKL
jgi:integrase